MTVQIRGFALAASLVCGVAAASGAGPYAVGFVQVREHRTSLVGTQRPVELGIFYPVDPAQVTGATPRATYLLTPFGAARMVPSTSYDQFGQPPVFSNVPVAGERPFPLVVNSHGGGGQWIAGIWFAPRIASHGYVVVLVSHLEVAATLTEAAVNRDGDLRFVLDRLLARNATEGDLLAGALDAERIVVSGYSLGGYNAIVLAGGDDEACDTLGYAAAYCGALAPDPRVKALLLIDAGNQFLWFYELARVNIPVLAVGQGYDSLLGDNGDPDWAVLFARQHAAFSGRPSYRVDLDPVRHATFGSGCENPIVLRDNGYITAAQAQAQLTAAGCFRTDLLSTRVAHDLATDYLLAFLETHVALRRSLQHVLTPGYALTHQSYVQFFVTEPNGGATAPDIWETEFSFFPYQPGAATERAEVDGIVGRPVPFEAEE